MSDAGIGQKEELDSWNEERARKIATALVRRTLPLFASLHEYGFEDLVAEALSAMRCNWHRFNPWKSQAGTFAYNIGHRHLISMYRTSWRDKKRGRKYERERVVRHDEAEQEMGYLPAAILESGPIDTKVPVAQWLDAVCLAARRAYAGRPRQGGGYQLDQLVGMAALMARMNFTPRKVCYLLKHRPDLRKILRLKAVPGYCTVWRAADVLTRLLETRPEMPGGEEVETLPARPFCREVETQLIPAAA